MVVDAPLGWDSTLAREVKGIVAACHCDVDEKAWSKMSDVLQEEVCLKWSVGYGAEMERRKKQQNTPAGGLVLFLMFIPSWSRLRLVRRELEWAGGEREAS